MAILYWIASLFMTIEADSHGRDFLHGHSSYVDEAEIPRMSADVRKEVELKLGTE